jgi:hypothetical protein
VRSPDGAWNNGRANYRCHHPRASGPGLPRSVFVREDEILPHLAALLIRLKAESISQRTLEDVDIPNDVDGQAAMCRELGLTLRYDHLAHTLITHSRQRTITIRLL